MIYRKLVTYSPFLLSLVLIGGLFLPGVIQAEGTDTVGGFIFDLAVGGLGMLVGLSAVFLNFAINEYVINFGDAVVSTGIGSAINSMWSLVRDFFNIIFIFSIIYLGFKMILGSDDSGTKRALVYLIIAALLVNFSLFISKFVVDFSNILATEVAQAAFPVFTDGAGDPVVGFVDIGTNFFNYMAIPTTASIKTDIASGDKTEWGYIVGILIVYVVAIFAFAAGAVLLVIRYAALCVFMVLSPFMFIGWILPQYAGLMRKYWSGFLGRAFFAPAYIVLLYFSGAVIIASIDSSANIGQALTDDAGLADSVGTFGAGLGPFILSAIMLIMSVQVASKLSADGAGTALRVGGNLASGGRRRLQNGAIWTGRKIERGVTAAPRYGARYGANLAGNNINQYLDRKQREGSKLANNWWVDEKVRGAASGLKATKAGFGNTIDERDKKQSKLDTRQEAWADIDAGREAASDKYQSPDPTAIYNPATNSIMAKSALSTGDLAAAEKAAEEREQAKAKMIGRLRDLSPKELEDLLQNDEKAFDEIINFLDDSKTQKLLESENLNTTEIKAVYNKRAKALKDSVIKQGVAVASEFNKLNIKQIELLGDQFIRDNAEMFNQDQWDAIKKSDKFTENQKESYKGARKKRVAEVLATGGSNPEVGGLIYESTGAIETSPGKWSKAIDPKKFKKPKEIAALPYNALVDNRLISQLPVDAVKQIGRDNAGGKSHLSATEIDNLYNKLLTNGNKKVQDYLATTRAQRDFLDKV